MAQSQPKNVWRLSRIIPALLALFCFADVAGRFIPIRHFAFRPSEAVQRYPDADGPLEPNIHVQMARASGDLSNAANDPDRRDYLSQVFTTDAFGFRNNPNLEVPGPYKILMLGDSFTAGMNLNDDETLPAQLERLTGRKVYNGALMKVDLIHILELTQRLHMDGGVIVYGFLTRQDVLSTRDAELPYWPFMMISRRAAAHLWHAVRNRWVGFWKVTPLEIMARRAMKKVENGRWLPNPYINQAEPSTLQNGVDMLQLPQDVRNFQTTRPTGSAGFLQLQNELKRRNFKLLIVLIPDKYTVYVPLLKENAGKTAPSNEFLDAIENKLKSLGVPVLNLTPPLRQAAQTALLENKTIYALDDTHWNKTGVSIAARQIAAFLKTSVVGQ